MNAKSNKHTADYLKTHSILQRLELNASGWEVGSQNPEVGGPFTYLYIWDRATQWTWMGSIPRQEFLRISRKAQAATDIHSNIRGTLAYLIDRAAAGTPAALETPGLAPMDWEHQLLAVLTGYAGTTKTYVAASELQEGGHFIVMNYRRPSERDGLLRPFVAGGDLDAVLPFDTLRDILERAMQMDRQNHPEWFR